MPSWWMYASKRHTSKNPVHIVTIQLILLTKVQQSLEKQQKNKSLGYFVHHAIAVSWTASGLADCRIKERPNIEAQYTHGTHIKGKQAGRQSIENNVK